MSKKAEFRDIAESRSRNGNGGGGQRREKCDIETDGNNVRGTLLVKVDYDARATFLLRFYSSPLKPLSPISRSQLFGTERAIHLDSARVKISLP